MTEENSIGTCLICKNDLVSKINIFKMRTNISKTLMSSKLSKIVQDSFSPEEMDIQDICTSCSTLLNHVDECECKLMALENEVKLKYKIPFAIEVQNRLPVDPPPVEPPPVEPPPVELPPVEPPPVELPPVGRMEELSSVIVRQQPEQEHNLISIPDESGFGTTTIVIQSTKVDTDGNIVIYREPTNDQLGQVATMPYLNDLEESGTQDDGGHQSDLSASDSEPGSEIQPSPRRQRRATKPGRSSKLSGRGGNKDYSVMCDLCDETYASAKCLEAHMASHANKKQLNCGFCTRFFTNHMLLHKHWNREHPLKLLPCPYCEQRFVTRSTLKRHMNIHQEPRFNCEFCARPFHAQGDLRKHVLIKHTDEKKFECSMCPMRFKMNWMLTRHRVRVHDKDTWEQV